MTCDRRLLLILTLLMAYGLFEAECRYRQQHEETSAEDARHRHRHRHESSASRKNRHELTDRRSYGWSQELDYEDESFSDRGDRFDEEGEEEEDEDYEVRSYYERSYPRNQRNNYRGRTYERRHASKHHRVGHHGSGWHDEENERRKVSSTRYLAGRSHGRSRPGSRVHHKYSRNRDESGYDADDEDDGDEDEAFDYERSRRYEDGSEKRYTPWWRSSRRHRTNWRRDWRSRQSGHDRRAGRRTGGYRAEDLEDDADRSGEESGRWRYEDRKRGSSHNDSSRISFSRIADDGKRNDEFLDDYDDRVDQRNEQREKDQEEDDIWKEAESDDDESLENDEDELDNDFYKSDRKPPLKTYDDIIRRLTADDPSTSRPTVKRDYRNIEVEKYSRHDSYGNFMYEPRNLSRPLGHDRTRITITPYVGTKSGYLASKTAPDASLVKLAGTNVDRKATKNAINATVKANGHHLEKKTAVSRIDHGHAKTKSLEQDYDEYVNAGDNEKEEDLIKAGVDEDSTGMQADVTNTDYTDDQGIDVDETPADETPTTSSSTTTSTTTTTTSTTTTTTPRPVVVTQHFDYRDTRAYESGTGSQYNGYQSKNEYPPMSAHSVHKWQSLGTRESVKETRGNMQQYNKNGKSAEIREALQHAIKVSREGSCQWPRARVIPVRDVYPSPSTTYIPHCAILHRCSDDTGCCRSEALTCVPKHSHRVELSFYTTNVGGASVVEKLSFYNHTECECRERAEHETANEKPVEQRFYRHYQPSPQPQNMRRAPPRKPCRCPSEFTPRITPEGECQCNCYEHDQNCIKTRRGKGYFSLADRLCIQNEECAMPSCEFGEYMRRQGKCPRKKDRFEAFANYRTGVNHRYIRS